MGGVMGTSNQEVSQMLAPVFHKSLNATGFRPCFVFAESGFESALLCLVLVCMFSEISMGHLLSCGVHASRDAPSSQLAVLFLYCKFSEIYGGHSLSYRVNAIKHALSTQLACCPVSALRVCNDVYSRGECLEYQQIRYFRSFTRVSFTFVFCFVFFHMDKAKVQCSKSCSL